MYMYTCYNMLLVTCACTCMIEFYVHYGTAGTREFPLSSPSLPTSSQDYITMAGLRSDDEKAIQELSEMLASSMSARDKADKDQAVSGHM